MTNESQQALVKLRTALNRSQGKSALSFLQKSGKPILLADCSGSMNCRDGNNELTRQELLNRELEILMREIPDLIVIAFSDYPMIAIPPLINMNGGTDMAAAFTMATSLRPSQVILISDGEPASEQDTLKAASRLSQGTRIDALYIGDPSNERCKSFMARLASGFGGQSLTEGSKLLESDLAQKIAGFLTDGSQDEKPIAL